MVLIMANSMRVNKGEEVTTITLNGPLDNDLASNLSNIISQTAPPIVIDLYEVPYIFAFGSQTIFNFYNQHQQKPAIQGANANVMSLLKLSGAIRYVDIPDDTKNLTQSAQE